jgi:hypothetical protein
VAGHVRRDVEAVRALALNVFPEALKLRVGRTLSEKCGRDFLGLGGQRALKALDAQICASELLLDAESEAIGGVSLTLRTLLALLSCRREVSVENTGAVNVDKTNLSCLGGVSMGAKRRSRYRGDKPFFPLGGILGTLV